MLDVASPGLPPGLAVPFGLVEHAFRRLRNLVQDMDQDELEYSGPAGAPNSTASLLRHLAFVDLGYLHCIKGEPIPEDLEAEYGPYHDETGRIPAVRGRSVEDLLQPYQRVIDMVRDYLRTQTDADAERPVRVPWWPEPATVRYVLWHMAGHSMFHQGQIRRLREWYRAGAPR